MTVFAKAGERVVTEDGEHICTVKNDLHVGGRTNPDDFEDWQVPKPARGQKMSKGFRSTRNFGEQVCIEGEWRP